MFIITAVTKLTGLCFNYYKCSPQINVEDFKKKTYVFQTGG